MALPPLAQAQSNEIEVYLDGERMQFQQPPVIIAGTTLVQFRPVFEKLGLDILWDPHNRRIQGLKDGQVIVDLQLDSKNAIVNNRTVTLDIAPTTINGNTIVPLRLIGEASGRTVKWSEYSRTIYIFKGFEKGTVDPDIGDDSYIASKDLLEYQNAQPHVYEKNGVVYVSWTKDFSVQNFYGTRFLTSVGTSSKWSKQNEQFYFINKTSGVNYLSFYADGSYFIKDDYGIKRVSLTDQGLGQTTTLSANMYKVNGSNETMRDIYVDGRPGVLYRQQYSINYGSMTTQVVNNEILYTNSTGSVDTSVNDYVNILSTIPSTTLLYYNTSNKTIYLIEGDSYRQFDTAKGEMVYGSGGKDLVTRFIADVNNNTTKHYFYDGTLYSFYLDNTSQYFKYYTVDSRMQASDTITTQIQQQDLYNKEVTFSNDSIKLWSVYEYNRKPSVKMELFSK